MNPDYVARTKAELQLLMRQNAGIVRNDADLLKAKENLSHWKNEVEEQIKSHNVNAELYELQNMITIGILIVQQSIDRKENRGGLVKINPKRTK
jgi:L-aspartate oxidase